MPPAPSRVLARATVAPLLAALTVGAALLVGCGGGDSPTEPAPRPSTPAAPPGPSPDPTGRFGGGVGRVVFVGDSGVRSWDLTAGRVTTLPISDGITGGVSAALDGSHAYLVEDPNDDDAVIIRVLDASGAVRHTFHDVHEFSFPVSGAVLSPDGRRVAWGMRVGTDEGAVRRTVFANVDGTDQRYVDASAPDVLTTASPNAGMPGWLPDGRLLVTTATGFLVSDSALRNVRRLPSPALANPGNPVATPDGRYIVFDQERGGSTVSPDDPATTSSAVWTLDVVTGEARLRVRSLIDVYAAGVSPDGRWLLVRDSAPFAITSPNVGAFRRWYLLVAPFSDAALDARDAQMVVPRDADGNQVKMFGRAGWY